MKAIQHLLMPAMLGMVAVVIGCERSGSEAVYSNGVSSIVQSQPDGDKDIEPLKVGDKAPDFEVEAMGGELLRLSRHLAEVKRPVVLLFDRAHW